MLQAALLFLCCIAVVDALSSEFETHALWILHSLALLRAIDHHNLSCLIFSTCPVPLIRLNRCRNSKDTNFTPFYEMGLKHLRSVLHSFGFSCNSTSEASFFGVKMINTTLFLTYFYLFIYILLSSGVILYNKVLLGSTTF